MTLPMLLTVITVGIAVAVMGVLSALTAEDRLTRARGWVFALMGLAIGVAACASWHSALAGRLISLLLVVQGGIVFERMRRDSIISQETTTELITEPLP